MTLRIPCSGKKDKFLTLVSVYAPTMTNPEETKDKFYEELNSIILNTPKSDKLMLLGDFNARVGSDNKIWGDVIGQYGVGKCNSNGLRLLQTCSEHGLLITNTHTETHTYTHLRFHRNIFSQMTEYKNKYHYVVF